MKCFSLKKESLPLVFSENELCLYIKALLHLTLADNLVSVQAE